MIQKAIQPMYYTEEVGGDKQAELVEKPSGDLVVQTRDGEQTPLDAGQTQAPSVHVHIDTGLGDTIHELAELLLEKHKKTAVEVEKKSMQVTKSPVWHVPSLNS